MKTKVCPAQPFWLSETLFLRVSHFFSKCPSTDNVTDCRTHDGPSCTTVMTVIDLSQKGLHIFSQVSYDGHLQRTVVTVTVRPAHTIMLVRDSPSGFSIDIESKYNTTDLTTSRHHARRRSLFLKQLHIIFTVLFCMVSLVLFATTRTNCDPLQVLSTMAPKQDRTYAHGRSKSVAPSARLIIDSDDERDPEYVPPGTSAPSRAARVPRATPKTVVSSVVTAS